ncbi:MAG: hypothetical protein M1114_02385, partial [Candidatus Dependentiae bacterium]|nr:hypothetical protein [Candidatus Dependentiae bacterium]
NIPYPYNNKCIYLIKLQQNCLDFQGMRIMTIPTLLVIAFLPRKHITTRLFLEKRYDHYQ